jgi:hypothetical protein
MQQDYFGRIPLLNAYSKSNARLFGGALKFCHQGNALGSVPSEPLRRRHGVYDGKCRAMRATQRDRVFESCARGIGKIDGGQKMSKLIHVTSPP